jgi:DNA-directed RNA polymerase beta' subunit
MILTHILVPPVNIRPSVSMDPSQGGYVLLTADLFLNIIVYIA